MENDANLTPSQQKMFGLYAALIESDRVIIRSTDKSEMFGEICRHVVELGGMAAAWVGMKDVGDQKIWPQAHFGASLNFAAFVREVAGLDQLTGLGPAHAALRNKQPVWCQDIVNDPTQTVFVAWAQTHGWRSAVVLPLYVKGEPIGVLAIYASNTHAFGPQAQKLLTQLASNVSYALDFSDHDEQRRLAEATLVESEVRYSALFANNCLPMLLVDPTSTRIVDANSRAANFYGWDQIKLKSMTVMDINVLSPDEIRQEIALAASTHKTHFDFKHRLANGEVRDVEVFSSPINVSGETYLLSAIHDVTERRRVESITQDKHSLIQQFIDELPGTVYLKDADFKLLMVNRALSASLGLESSEIVGKTAYDIFPKNFADVITELDRQLLIDGGRRTVEESLNGRHFVTNMFTMADPKGNRLLGGLSLDVTDRYRAAELTTVLLQINELGGLLPEKEFLTRGLEMAQTLTGSVIGFLHFVNDDQETLELATWTAGALRGCTAAYDNHYPVSEAGIWADCLREKKAVVFNDYAEYQKKHGLPEGHAPLVRLISVPVIEDGMVRMMMGVGNKNEHYDDIDVDVLNLIGNDLWRIARRARAEQALHKRVEDLVALNQRLADIQLQLLQSEKMASIGQLAAGVAHEINNPIGFVKSNLGTLTQYADDLLNLAKAYAELDQTLGKKQPEFFESLRRRKADMDFDFVVSDLPQLLAESRDGVERVQKIVMDLKGFSRASDNEWQWTDLHTGIESTINVVWNQLKYKAEVKREFADLPPVYCVASQINQVLMNLLVNAGQAIKERGHIVVRTGVGEGRVWIEVQDDGCGISEQDQTRIFEPFFTSKPVGEGTGLGLSIASGIVSRHQGRIVLTSHPGVGSTFRIELPIKPASQEDGGDSPPVLN